MSDGEYHDQQHHDDADFGHGDHGLQHAALPHAEVVQIRQQHDAGDRCDADAGVAHRYEEGDVAGKDDGTGGDDAGVGAPEHGPAPEEPAGGREGLFQEDVYAAGAGKGGGEFGADQRAEQSKNTARHPDQEHARDIRHMAIDFRWLNEDGSADDDADHHGGGMEQSNRPVEGGAWFGTQVGSVYHAERPSGWPYCKRYHGLFRRR